MKLITLFLCFGFVVDLIAVQPDQENEGHGSYEDYFSVVLPKDYKVTEEPRGEDFQVFGIGKGEHVMVRVYVGNFPDFPQRKPAATSSAAELKGHGFTLLSEWVGGQLINREFRADLSYDNSRPAFLHAWIEQSSPSELAVADAVLMSIEVKFRSDAGVKHDVSGITKNSVAIEKSVPVQTGER